MLLTSHGERPLTHRDAASATVARVTVVNDNPEFLELLRELLEDERYAVTTVDSDLPNSLSRIRESQPQLLIMDLRMGSDALHGWDISQQVRETPELQDLPIIICSADLLALRDLEADMQSSNRVATLTKPFALGELTETVSGLLAE